MAESSQSISLAEENINNIFTESCSSFRKLGAKGQMLHTLHTKCKMCKKLSFMRRVSGLINYREADMLAMIEECN